MSLDAWLKRANDLARRMDDATVIESDTVAVLLECGRVKRKYPGHPETPELSVRLLIPSISGREGFIVDGRGVTQSGRESIQSRFCRAFDVDPSWINQLRNQLFIAELWEGNKLVGLIKLSTHPFWLAFNQYGRVHHQGNMPVVAFNHYCPVQNPFQKVSTTKDVDVHVHVILAMGSPHQILHFKSQHHSALKIQRWWRNRNIRRREKEKKEVHEDTRRPSSESHETTDDRDHPRETLSFEERMTELRRDILEKNLDITLTDSDDEWEDIRSAVRGKKIDDTTLEQIKKIVQDEITVIQFRESQRGTGSEVTDVSFSTSDREPPPTSLEELNRKLKDNMDELDLVQRGLKNRLQTRTADRCSYRPTTIFPYRKLLPALYKLQPLESTCPSSMTHEAPDSEGCLSMGTCIPALRRVAPCGREKGWTNRWTLPTVAPAAPLNADVAASLSVCVRTTYSIFFIPDRGRPLGHSCINTARKRSPSEMTRSTTDNIRSTTPTPVKTKNRLSQILSVRTTKPAPLPRGAKELNPVLSPKASITKTYSLPGHEQYTSLSHLGSGSYGQIFTATDKLTGGRVIIKKMPKTAIDCRVDAEVEAGEILKHVPGIQHLHREFATANHSCLVFDYVEGWDFFSFLEARKFKPLPEKLVTTLIECHKRGVGHKDVKLENVIVHPDGRTITLIDFGLCSFLETDGARCTDFSGSKEYCPPEVLLRRPFDATKADVWSLGVTLYCLLFGRLPFDVIKDHNTLSLTGHHPKVRFPSQTMSIDGVSAVSEGARGLVEKMLQEDPLKRISMSDVLSHVWLRASSLSILH
ncbi:CAMK family protein kinase [Planoprotostelium fungivorum]|uniref:CAMK family protein kinase n=1 Tax=Planoprotostelium fungivorum TaxID=1890364 RepID=A0A2P6MZZ7_9EUKA|nr:CAMK family protein kinase [Planoprotostelium fungivorum]